MNLIDSIPSSHYKPLQYRNQLLWKSYEQLNGFVNKNFSADFQDILAKPFSSGNSFNWHSSRAGEYKPLDTFPLAHKQQSLLFYHSLLISVREKISALQASANPDNLIWADMLSQVFNVANNILYSNGRDIVLLWGFEFQNSEENYIDPVLLSDYLARSEHAVREEVTNIVDDATQSPVENSQDDMKAELSQKEYVPLSKHIIVRSNKKQHFRDSFIYKYWWTLILLALLLLFLYWHFMDRSRGGGMFSEQQSLEMILPSDPLKRPPIDTSKIIKGDSGTSRIISDLFNIALKDKTKKLSSFVLDLKKKFPDSAYQIVFYDTSTARIQFQFPDTDRDQLKQKIKKELDEYSLLIWDESIFINSKLFNDPVFNDPDKHWYLMAVGAPAAWEISTGHPDVTIAVVDDGFDLNNKDLNANIVKPFNVKTRNSSVVADAQRFHGTHVAGIALGKANNNFGVSGMAPDCSFMPVQIAGNDQVFTSSDVIDGVLYAIRNGADVINLSLGKYYPKEVESLPPDKQKELAQITGQDEAEFWNELFLYAEKENIVVVIASGNQHIMVGLDPMQRSDKTIKVSAINKKLEPASFSNYGNQVTIYAPGENIYGLIPDNQEKFMDGTSMASPIVSGTIALMKSRKKDISNKDIFALLRKNADAVRNAGGNSQYIRADKLLKALQ